MEKIFFTVTCKTNLHVGSGKANYGVVDNLVQRDPTNHYPTIHASSLKGAIKEYCYHKGSANVNMKAIFGSDKLADGKTNREGTQVGEYKFFDANLLTIPVRCDKQAFVHISCSEILKDLCDNLLDNSLLKKELEKLIDLIKDMRIATSNKLERAVIEDDDIKVTETIPSNESYPLTSQLLADWENIVFVKDNDFKRLTNDLHLPVIARNYLENGESKNLWYEQVVPRKSVFWSMCFVSKNYGLFTELCKTDTLVQIGANGSIGYGYCSFKQFNTEL